MSQVIVPGFAAYAGNTDGATLTYAGVGTGAAISAAESAANGVDVVIADSPVLEAPFVAGGFSLASQPAGRAVAHDDYVIVGPASDPAGVASRDPSNAAGAFAVIAGAGAAGHAKFLTRNDVSGTNAKEERLWGQTTGVMVQPALNGSGPGRDQPWTGSGTAFPSWYVPTGTTEGANVIAANQCAAGSGPDPYGDCYAIVNRATLYYEASIGNTGHLRIVSSLPLSPGLGSALIDPVHVYVVDSSAHAADAQRFVNFLTSAGFQDELSAFLLGGQQVFYADAVPAAAVATAGGGTPGGARPTQCVCDPVNAATGDYVEPHTDIAFGGPGPALAMKRTYSSVAAAAGERSVLGPGWSFAFGASLKLDSRGNATVTNGNGSQTVFTPTSVGFLAPEGVLATLARNSDGTYAYVVRARQIMTFSASGVLTRITDLNGNAITLSYGSAGQLTSAANGFGASLAFGYNAAGQLTGVSDSASRSVTYAYDSSGNLAEVTDVRGGHTFYTYNASRFLLTREDANGNVVLTNTFDATGRIVKQVDARGHPTSFVYTNTVAAPTSSTQVTDPDGDVTLYSYAEGGLLQATTKGYGTTHQASWSYGYTQPDDPAEVTAVTDPNGHTTSYTYDAGGNVTSVTDPDRDVTRSTYDPLDDVTATTDANHVTTRNTYDASGDLLSTATPLGNGQTRTTSLVYDSHGQPTSITDPTKGLFIIKFVV